MDELVRYVGERSRVSSLKIQFTTQQTHEVLMSAPLSISQIQSARLSSKKDRKRKRKKCWICTFRTCHMPLLVATFAHKSDQN